MQPRLQDTCNLHPRKQRSAKMSSRRPTITTARSTRRKTLLEGTGTRRSRGAPSRRFKGIDARQATARARQRLD
eukprot:3343292-Pyramimonas_sp.AAC.1